MTPVINDVYEFIERFEGCKLKAYQDSAGIWTIGVGHTKNVKKGDVITLEQARKYFANDVNDTLDLIQNNVRVPASSGELTALISQAFNMTTKSFIKLAEYFNHDKDLWREKTLLYCHDVKGHKLAGLFKRRCAEYLVSLGKPWKSFVIECEKNPNIEYMQKRFDYYCSTP